MNISKIVLAHTLTDGSHGTMVASLLVATPKVGAPAIEVRLRTTPFKSRQHWPCAPFCGTARFPLGCVVLVLDECVSEAKLAFCPRARACTHTFDTPTQRVAQHIASVPTAILSVAYRALLLRAPPLAWGVWLVQESVRHAHAWPHIRQKRAPTC